MTWIPGWRRVEGNAGFNTGAPVHTKRVNGLDLFVFKQTPPSWYACVIKGHTVIHGNSIVEAMTKGEAFAKTIGEEE
jgi:hypothetical protein